MGSLRGRGKSSEPLLSIEYNKQINSLRKDLRSEKEKCNQIEKEMEDIQEKHNKAIQDLQEKHNKAIQVLQNTLKLRRGICGKYMLIFPYLVFIVICLYIRR